MFRLLMGADESDAADITKDFAMGFSAYAAEEISPGQTVAMSTVVHNQVLKANSNDPLRRAICGIALEGAQIGGLTKIAMYGRVAAAEVVPGALKGSQLSTTATDGAISSTPGVGAPRAIATALADEAGGAAPVWIGPSAA